MNDSLLFSGTALEFILQESDLAMGKRTGNRAEIEVKLNIQMNEWGGPNICRAVTKRRVRSEPHTCLPRAQQRSFL